MLGLLLNAESPPRAIELHNSITFRIVHGISKHASTASLGCGFPQVLGEIVPIKNIVAQHQSARAASKKRLPQQKSLRDSFRLKLHLVLQSNSKLISIPQQRLKLAHVFRSSYKKDVAN